MVQSQTRNKDQSIQAEESQARSREDQDGDGPSDDVFLLKLQTERAVMAATVADSLAGLDISKDKTADYKKLIEYGLDAKVADKLDEIYKVEVIILYGLISILDTISAVVIILIPRIFYFTLRAFPEK